MRWGPGFRLRASVLGAAERRRESALSGLRPFAANSVIKRDSAWSEDLGGLTTPPCSVLGQESPKLVGDQVAEAEVGCRSAAEWEEGVDAAFEEVFEQYVDSLATAT
jgi:hypothetical protein